MSPGDFILTSVSNFLLPSQLASTYIWYVIFAYSSSCFFFSSSYKMFCSSISNLLLWNILDGLSTINSVCGANRFLLVNNYLKCCLLWEDTFDSLVYDTLFHCRGDSELWSSMLKNRFCIFISVFSIFIDGAVFLGKPPWDPLILT